MSAATLPDDAPTARKKDTDKTMARIGVALGATMLIVGLTGSSWLKKRPQKPPVEPVPISMHRVPLPPNARAAAPVAEAAASVETLTVKPVAPVDVPALPPKATSLDIDFHRRELLRARYGLTVDEEVEPPVKESVSSAKAPDGQPKKGEKSKAAQDWPEGFNPALYAFKALAYATGIVLTTFGTAIYATCWYYDAWDPELLAHDLSNSFTRTLGGFKPFMNRILEPVKQPDLEPGPMVTDGSDRMLADIARRWKLGTETDWLSEKWIARSNAIAKEEEAKKAARLGVLIAAREERARRRQLSGQ